ncbi:MAG: NAD-dependent epimerase/dehydratase family protein [Clostridium sp.]|jgi:nucleoside-diphosphate-sugar epimerase
MRIVVTGATSFVGLGAVRELLDRGHQVLAVLRENSQKTDLLKENGKFPENLTILYEDLGNLQRLPEKIQQPCDVFLHMGWRGAGSDSRKQEAIQELSVEDALGAVHAAGALGCRRFLFTGSQAEYGLRSSLTDEEAPCHPTSPYGAAKLKVRREAERLCRELSMDYGHVRIFSVYGPGDHPWSLLSSCIRTFESGGRMEMTSCEQLWNFLYIEDAGRGLAALAEYKGNLAEHGCVYNLGGPMEETGPLRGFVEEVYGLCGEKGEMKFGVRPANAEGIVSLIPDIRKMERVVSWKPEVGFSQGIRTMLRKL